MGRGGQHNFARNTRKPLISLGIIGLLALVGCWVDDVDYNFKAERPGDLPHLDLLKAPWKVQV